MPTTRTNGFSADVRLSLRVNGDLIDVAQVDPSTLTLRGEYGSHGPCAAILTIVINDFTEQQDILLPNGIDASSRHVNYSRVSA